MPRRWGKENVEREAPGPPPPPPRRGVAVMDTPQDGESRARIERAMKERPGGFPPAPKVVAQGAATKRDEAITALCDYARLEFLPRVLDLMDDRLP